MKCDYINAIGFIDTCHCTNDARTKSRHVEIGFELGEEGVLVIARSRGTAWSCSRVMTASHGVILILAIIVSRLRRVYGVRRLSVVRVPRVRRHFATV
jgi:hypothetical protein